MTQIHHQKTQIQSLNEIEAFLVLLRRQFPLLSGLEDPLKIMYDPDKCIKTEAFIRVMLSRTNHWVCVAGGYRCENEDVLLFDSMNRTTIDKNLDRDQVRRLYPPESVIDRNGRITFKVKKTQKQTSMYCDYYALAFGTALYFQEDTEALLFDQRRIWQHFLTCIISGGRNRRAEMFPHTRKQTKNTQYALLR